MKQGILYRFKWFRLIMFCLLAYFAYWAVIQQNNLNAIYREAETARMHLEQANQTNAALLQERNRLKDKAYVEKLAREELGLVKPGETPYVPVRKD